MSSVRGFGQAPRSVADEHVSQILQKAVPPPRRSSNRGEAIGRLEVDVIVDRVAGLDISKADVKVCVRVPRGCAWARSLSKADAHTSVPSKTSPSRPDSPLSAIS
jgi:hypothetical protein